MFVSILIIILLTLGVISAVGWTIQLVKFLINLNQESTVLEILTRNIPNIHTIYRVQQWFGGVEFFGNTYAIQCAPSVADRVKEQLTAIPYFEKIVGSNEGTILIRFTSDPTKPYRELKKIK